MALKVGVVGYYQRFNSANMITSEVVKITTKNIGNLMFRYAVCRDLGDFVQLNTKMEPEEVREKVDVIALPMANNVNPFFNMGYLARFISKCDLPVMVFGLGAQAALGQKTISDLPEGSKRFLKEISIRNDYIGVRGPFTASILNDYGIKNSIVMGCPSNFISKNPDLGLSLEEERNSLVKNGTKKLAIYSQLGGKNFEKFNLDSEKWLFEMMLKYNAHYIHNFPADLIDYSRGGREVKLKWKKNFHNYISPQRSFNSFNRLFRKYSMAFTSIESWMEFSRSCDLSIGKRVHGCLNTIQSGTFGVLITHDERTKELANTVGLPHIPKALYEQNDTPKELLQKVDYNGRSYNQKRKKLFNSYHRIYKSTGVQLKNELVKHYG